MPDSDCACARPGPAGRFRGPTLLLLVYGVCLVLVGITASAQAEVISQNYQQSAMTSIVENDAALVRAVVNSAVRPTDLPPAGPTPERRAELIAMLRPPGGPVRDRAHRPVRCRRLGDREQRGRGRPPAAAADRARGKASAAGVGQARRAEADRCGRPRPRLRP